MTATISAVVINPRTGEPIAHGPALAMLTACGIRPLVINLMCNQAASLASNLWYVDPDSLNPLTRAELESEAHETVEFVDRLPQSDDTAPVIWVACSPGQFGRPAYEIHLRTLDQP